MALHRGQDRFLPLLNGNVMTTGGSLNLAKGQLGVFNVKKPSQNGLTAISNFAGLSNDTELQVRVGNHENAIARTQGNKNKETRTFKLSEIIGLDVNVPSEQTFDEIIIGYDGINPETALTFEVGDNDELNVTLSGEGIGTIGYGDARATINAYFKKTSEDQTNQEIVEQAAEMLRNNVLKEMIPVSTFIDVDVINSENPTTVEGAVPHTYYNLTLPDLGDSNALGNVQAQYDLKVVQTDRVGLNSVYTILRPTADGLPDAFVQTVDSVLKGCEDCPAGFTAEDGGFIYYVSLEDDGADESATVEALAGAITDSAIKQGQENGVGIYAVATDDKVTDAEIATFVTANPTATIEFVGETAAICNNASTSTVAWVAGDECNATTEEYTIQLKDDKCGENRLTELQEAYPDLTIAIATADAQAISQDVTLTGTSGTANITVEGAPYTATFNTDLSTTASDFVTAHSASLAAEGVTVTANAGVLTFVNEDLGAEDITIENATGDLAGTVGAQSEVSGNVDGGCQTVYATNVTTDIVCEDCDPIFRGLFESQPPADYGFSSWEKAPKTYSETALMGIKLTGKPVKSIPSEYFRDDVPFINSSTRIEVSAGHFTGQSFSYEEGGQRFNVDVLSRASEATNLGGHLWALEDRDFTYFNGHPRHRHGMDSIQDQYAKAILGEESVLKPNAQYVIYNLTVAPRTRTQMTGRFVEEKFVYMIAAEVGKHKPVEDLLNNLVATVGLPTVRAYGNQE